jgi:predicted permease
MEILLADAAHAFRVLRRDARFSIAALTTLALGIGATTAVFSTIYSVLFRPLPYADAGRLVRVYEVHQGAPLPPGDPQLANTTMYAWRRRLKTLEDMAAYYGREYTVTFDGEAVRIHGAEASSSLFPLLRVNAQVGRFFTAAEDAPNANRVVVISDRLWRRRFGTRSDVIGRAIAIESKVCTIVGVAPPDFAFPDREVELWTPYEDPTLTDPSVQGGMWLAPTLGRLKPGVTRASAEAEGTAAARSMPRPAVANLLFGTGGAVQVRVDGLSDLMTSRVRPALIVLGASVVFVLLATCANVANLFLARGVLRQRELALRTAIGASRRQLVRQLLVESTLIAAIGAALGVAVAWMLLTLIPSLAPQDFPRLDSIRLDRITLLVALVACAVAALASGLVPALRSAGTDPVASLAGGAGDRSVTLKGSRLRDVLLIVESSLATILVVGAALLGRSFVALIRVDPGYDARNVLAARVYPPPSLGGERSMAFVHDLVARLREQPDVVSAGAGNMLPLTDGTWIAGFTVPESLGRGKPAHARTVSYLVTPGYAEALRLRLVSGRLLTTADASPEGPLRVLVNQQFVREYLADMNPAGLAFSGGPYKSARTEIVGVVGDLLKDGNDSPALAAIFSVATAARSIRDEISIVMRMRGDPAAGAPILRSAVRSLDAGAAIGAMMPLSSQAWAATAQPRFAAAVLTAFAVLALVLASVGLYGMLTHTVAQRRRELGVRVALGASRRSLLSLVLRTGLLPACVGTAIGAMGAAALARLMGSLLFGVTPLDAPAYLAAPCVLLPIAAVACLAPAWRAAGTDPAVVLRGD